MSRLPDWLHPWRWYAATVIVEALCRCCIFHESAREIGARFGRPAEATTWRSLYRWRAQLLVSPTLWGWLGRRLGIREPAWSNAHARGYLERLLAEGRGRLRSAADLVAEVPAAVRRTLSDLVHDRKSGRCPGQFPPGKARQTVPGRERRGLPTEKDPRSRPP